MFSGHGVRENQWSNEPRVNADHDSRFCGLALLRTGTPAELFVIPYLTAEFVSHAGRHSRAAFAPR